MCRDEAIRVEYSDIYIVSYVENYLRKDGEDVEGE